MAEKFEFKYSALTQEEKKEIDSIRRQYLPQEKTMTKIERLKYLDKKIKNTTMAVGISLGVVGILIFGLGLTFILEWNQIVLGLCLMLVGTIISVLAYPIYKVLLKDYKAKYGNEIVSLSNELLDSEKE